MPQLFCHLQRISNRIHASITSKETDGVFQWYRVTPMTGMQLIQSDRYCPDSPIQYDLRLDDCGAIIACRFCPDNESTPGNFAEIQVPVQDQNNLQKNKHPDPGVYHQVLSQLQTLSALNIEVNEHNAKLRTLLDEQKRCVLETKTQVDYLKSELDERNQVIEKLQNQNMQLEQGLRSLSASMQRSCSPRKSPLQPTATTDIGSEVQGEGDNSNCIMEERRKLKKQLLSLRKREAKLQQEYAEIYSKQIEMIELRRQVETLRADRDRLQEELLLTERELTERIKEGYIQIHEGCNMTRIPMRDNSTLTDIDCGNDELEDDNNELIVMNNSLKSKCESLQREVERLQRTPTSDSNTNPGGQNSQQNPIEDNKAKAINTRSSVQHGLSQIISWTKQHLQDRKPDLNDYLKVVTSTLSETICEKDEQIRVLQETLQALAQGES